MTEALRGEQAIPPIPSRFNRMPFCNPGADNYDALQTVMHFDPSVAVSDRAYYDTCVAAAYDLEKAPETHERERADTPSGIDLRFASHVEGMAGHTILHALTGDLRMGVSDTDSIPYWDRQAVVVGAQHLLDLEVADAYISHLDALSINVLRAQCMYHGGPIKQVTNSIELITSALSRGKRSLVDISDKQQAKITEQRLVLPELTIPLIPKLKHLMWLVDQEPNPAIRQHVYPEILDNVQQAFDAGVTQEDLTVDMGVDTGISSDSHRPPYQIDAFVQLAHLHDPNASVQEYTLPQEICHRIGVSAMLDSILRPGHTQPAYEEDGRYQLPWRFTD